MDFNRSLWDSYYWLYFIDLNGEGKDSKKHGHVIIKFETSVFLEHTKDLLVSLGTIF